MKNYFTEKELKCRCGCGLNKVRASSLERLNHAREFAGEPFSIGPNNRACSCREHNKAIGGSDTSSHIASEEEGIECKAFDLDAEDSRKRFVIIEALIRAGFTRIGIAKTFIHVDDDESKSPEVIWLY